MDSDQTLFQNGRVGIIVANLFVTLDGVYQAPGASEEDTAGGFAFGGWQAPVSDDEAGVHRRGDWPHRRPAPR